MGDEWTAPLYSSGSRPLTGGKPTAPGAYPEVAIMGRDFSAFGVDWHSTGVLIHPRVFLSAAHCHQPPTTRIDFAALPIDRVADITPALVAPVHGLCLGTSDVSVFVIDEGHASSHVVPVLGASAEAIEAALEVQVVGFGADVYAGPEIDTKREAGLRVHSIAKGGHPPPGDAKTLGYDPASEFCTKKPGVQACAGDSGAPAFLDVGGRWMLAGICSREAIGHGSGPCGGLTIFTRIDAVWNDIRAAAALLGVDGL